MSIRRQRQPLQWIVNRLFNGDSLVLEIYIVCPALEKVDFCPSRSHRLQSSAEFKRSNGRAGEQRCEREVGPRRNDYSLVFGGVESTGDGEACPA
jgi:hypothetical protein